MNILNLFNKIKAYKDKDHSKLYITPVREWTAILFLGLILSSGAFYFYSTTIKDIYVNRFEESYEYVEMDPYKTKELKIELSEILGFYKTKKMEHSLLLEKQPIFENKGIPVVLPETPENSLENLENEISSSLTEMDFIITEGLNDNNEGTTTEEEFLVEEVISKTFDTIQSGVYNTASVFKSFFD